MNLPNEQKDAEEQNMGQTFNNTTSKTNSFKTSNNRETNTLKKWYNNACWATLS